VGAHPYVPAFGPPRDRPGVFDDQFTLKFVEGGRDMEKQPPLGRAGVDIACQHLEHLFLLLGAIAD